MRLSADDRFIFSAVRVSITSTGQVLRSVRLSVGMSVRSHISITACPKFVKFSVHVACYRDGNTKNRYVLRSVHTNMFTGSVMDC